MPLLIYDDTCYLCGKFAQMARRLSHNSVDVVGHYSEYGMSMKRKIFPAGFDPTTMFWLVKDRQAFGGRSGLLPVAVEILKGVFRPSAANRQESMNFVCSNEELACNTPADFAKRVSMLIRNGKKIKLEIEK